MAKIKKFSIRKLYEERDIEIDFSDPIKIIVAENGYGKTTVLNALYALFSSDISKLRRIDFESLEIEFDDGDTFTVKKEELKFSSELFKKSGFYSHLKNRLGDNILHNLLEAYTSQPLPNFRRSLIFKSSQQKLDMPPSALINFLDELVGPSKSTDNLALAKETLSQIRAKINHHILYLPTYRRVEQDFRDMGLSEDSEHLSYDGSINFGMRDVDKKIKEITKEILTSSVEWFSKVNGEMLGQLVEGIKVDAIAKASINNPEAIKIVLDRIGGNIAEPQKLKILELISNGQIFNDHDPLIYFLSNLSKVYEQQKENDKAIQSFTEVCNKYLVDKKLEYNESAVSVDIIRRKNGKPVDIETLSSGEKQIISLFSTLYLQKEKDLAIFYDEPELSLSIEWQKTLLPDILASGRCSFLFATTHSPFIFENELINHTSDLASCIKEL